jgi:hypothetical protein
MLERLTLDSASTPLRAASVLSQPDYFKFDIRVTAKDCPSADVSLAIKKGHHWDKPIVQILEI